MCARLEKKNKNINLSIIFITFLSYEVESGDARIATDD